MQNTARARVACKLCNSRRVRCDRPGNGDACTNCQLANASCELIVSKRGKHKRQHTGRKLENRAPPPPPVIALDTPSEGSTFQEQTNHHPSDNVPRFHRNVSPSLSEIAVQKDPVGTGEKVIYMGDSANFKYCVSELGNPFKASAQPVFFGDKLQQAVMDNVGHDAQKVLRAMRSDEDEWLRKQGVFDYPEKEIRDKLIHSFFEISHPACPIFNRQHFMKLHVTGRLSPLILNAVLFMAVLHCPVSVLRSMGFASRYIASQTFHRRAKALYDAGYEPDGTATVQALILMSNWSGGPMEQKDTWHWLGVASAMAQSLGMHRTRSYSYLTWSQQTIWRRTWWVLFINDVHHAAVYGRPPHINPSFCDIRPLTEEDFQDYDSAAGTGSRDESKLYLIHFAELASRAATCITTKYSPAAEVSLAQKRHEELVDFGSYLSPEFSNVPSSITLKRGFWPALIHLYHLDYQIVFYRLLCDRPENDVLFSLASKAMRLLEDVLASGLLYRAPLHIFPSIFASTLIHIIQMRKGDDCTKVLCEHRVRLAMHILEGFQDSWPLVVCTRHFLDSLLNSITGDVSKEADKAHTPPPMTHAEPGKSAMTQYSSAGNAGGGIAAHADNMSYLSGDEPLEPHPFVGGCHTPVMPLFSFGNIAEEMGIDADAWLLDISNNCL